MRMQYVFTNRVAYYLQSCDQLLLSDFDFEAKNFEV